MKKIKFNLNELEVESFITSEKKKQKGTVMGFNHTDNDQTCVHTDECSVGLDCLSVVSCTTNDQFICDIPTGGGLQCSDDTTCLP